MKQVLVSKSAFFNHVAILQDGRLIDYLFEINNNQNVVGNIYKGRVMNILPGMEAAFVDIGLDKNAYLFLDDLLSNKFLKEANIKKKDVTSISKVLKIGDELLVQIVRGPMGEKNISVTTDISLSGKFIAFIPNSRDVNLSRRITNPDERKRLEEIGRNVLTNGNGMIIRTFAKGCSKEAIEKEYKMLSNVYKQIEREYKYSYAPKLLYKSNSLIERLFLDYIDSSVGEIYVEDDAERDKFRDMISTLPGDDLKDIKIIQAQRVFENFDIDRQVRMLFDRKVELENGGFIVIDVTEALTVIDVNSGKYTGSRNMEETALAINLKALEEIARQIKLRNISGIILIDFIDVKKEESLALITAKAKALFRDDKTKTAVVGMTKLNIMEITRKRNTENFYNLITEECTHCRGSGRSLSKLYIFIKIETIIKNIKYNTSAEAVILKVGCILYHKIIKNCLDIIAEIEKKYDIRIHVKKDSNILSDEILVGKMGSIDYIESIKDTV
ncbi:MAG: Rne/Rng family ribonuclease [Tissierellia bacterium]|jgi:ribonuclease G|nr:Rne/Rng family ribonuclease [Tissierellia bacterium]